MGPNESPRDSNAIAAYLVGQIFQYVVQKAGNDLTRENVLRQATTLRDVKLKMLLPGVALNNSSASYTAFRQYQMSRF